MMDLLRVLIEMVMRAFFPSLFDWGASQFSDSAEDSRPDPELTTRLLTRIKEAGLIILLCSYLFACGCSTRTVYVSEGEPVRLRKDIPNAKVWVRGAKGTLEPSTVTLKEGWYVLSDPKNE